MENDGSRKARRTALAAALLVGGAASGTPLFAAAPLAVAQGMFGSMTTMGAALVIVFLILSLGVHEAAHAWVAYKCGDSTAKDLGRMTLNPIPHIDPFMTILLPTLLMMSGGFIFGGAKPVPVVFHRLRHPWRDMMFVALAGPISNVILAIVFFAVWRFALMDGGYTNEMLLPQVMRFTWQINIVLAIFNMIPIPPLDGSRVLAWALPESMRPGYVGLERFGFALILVLFFTGVFGTVLNAAYQPVTEFVRFAATLGGLW